MRLAVEEGSEPERDLRIDRKNLAPTHSFN